MPYYLSTKTLISNTANGAVTLQDPGHAVLVSAGREHGILHVRDVAQKQQGNKSYFWTCLMP
jgi:hypothetical protein